MVVAEVCSSMKYPKRSQYKHAKQKKYHVRNWAEYNEGLRRRGDLTVWFDEEAIANWKADKTGKPGGQRVYSDMAIETGLVVRMVYKHPLLRRWHGSDRVQNLHRGEHEFAGPPTHGCLPVNKRSSFLRITGLWRSSESVWVGRAGRGGGPTHTPQDL